MNRWLKIAWYNVIVISATLIVTGILVGALAIKVGMPKALGGLGCLGFLGLLGLSPILFRKGSDKVDFDERDIFINFRAILAAYSIFWLVFTAACMIPWFIIGPAGSISVNVLPLMLCGICVALTLVQSIATLIQYGWAGKGEKS